MDNSATSIVLVILAGIVLVGTISIAIFVNSDDFQEFMAVEENETEEVPPVPIASANASTSFVEAVTFKESTVDKVLNAIGVDTSREDSVYESKAMVFATVKTITIALVLMGTLIGVVSLVMYLREEFKKKV